MKQYLFEQLTAVLNSVGLAKLEDTAGFKGVKHDQFIDAFQQWLLSYPDWLTPPSCKPLQGLRDQGCDLKIDFESADFSVIFQVKSWHDISEKDFSAKLKQQIFEASNSYEYDFFYITFCADLTDKSQYQKVRIFQADLERGKQNNIIVINAEHAWQLYSSFTTPVNVNKVTSILGRNINKFLHTIGYGTEILHPQSILANLEQVYEPPQEYPQIQQQLEDNGIVFIVGSPHSGKTLTAINLLFEYYQQGYQPFWLLKRDLEESNKPPTIEAYNQSGIQDSFSIQDVIKDNTIVYIEDPFGNVESNDLQIVHSRWLFNIEQILKMLKVRTRLAGKHPPKMIITSRKSIFKQAFQQQMVPSEAVIELRIGDHESEDVSYDFSRRVEIIQKYERLYQPKWIAEEGDQKPYDLEKLSEFLCCGKSLT